MFLHPWFSVSVFFPSVLQAEVVSVCWMSTTVQPCFSSCHTIAFSADMDFCGTCLIPAQISSQAEMELLRSFGLFFFFAMMRKKVQYFNPPSLSHVQASICMSPSNVIIPFCSDCCHRVVLVLLASFLFQQHISQCCIEVI